MIENSFRVHFNTNNLITAAFKVNCKLFLMFLKPLQGKKHDDRDINHEIRSEEEPYKAMVWNLTVFFF